jgi:RNA-directed DNA polymerase
MSEPRLQGKTHDIPKRLIWAAWLKVKSKDGAAGADGVTIDQFEVRVQDNLFKLWLRREALMVRVAVRDRHHPAVVAVG